MVCFLHTTIESKPRKGSVVDNQRVGRLNTTTLLNETTIQKVAHVVEADRQIRLGIEAWALSVAKQRGLDVPTVYSYSRDRDGCEMLMMERIKGTPLERVPDYKARARAMFEVGKQLCNLESVSSTFGWIHPETHVGSHPSWRQFLVDYVDRFAGILAQYGLLASDLGQKLLQMTRDLDDSLKQASLVHRDVKPGNLILRSNGGVAIIDWENAIFGDSIYDVALYEVREGQSLASSEFARGSQTETSSQRYRLYGAIALLGMTDFQREYRGDAESQAARLGELIERL